MTDAAAVAVAPAPPQNSDVSIAKLPLLLVGYVSPQTELWHLSKVKKMSQRDPRESQSHDGR